MKGARMRRWFIISLEEKLAYSRWIAFHGVDFNRAKCRAIELVIGRICHASICMAAIYAHIDKAEAGDTLSVSRRFLGCHDRRAMSQP